jgi:hypothetical protein
MTTLKFGKGNAKLSKLIATISLPSGFTCPGALECLSKANKITGKITDGAQTVFRCFSASQEALYRNVRENRWFNFGLLKGKTVEETAELILASLPKQDIVRIHVGGDFFSQVYFDAWMLVAERTPDKIFYAYTKSIKFWTYRFDQLGRAGTANFKLTASRGGRDDCLIGEFDLKEAVVVFTEEQAEEKGLAIDHDDTLAYLQDKSFALLLHGAQPAGSEASKALQVLKKKGKGGYSKKKIQKVLDKEVVNV